MGGERGQLSQNIFQTIPDIDFSTTSLAVFQPCYISAVNIFENNFILVE